MSDSNVPSVPVTSGTSLSTINKDIKDNKKEEFIRSFVETGNFTTAASIIGHNPCTVYDWLHKDSDFMEEYQKAKWLSAELLIKEAERRATGYEEELSYQGVKTGDKVTRYSDNLLMFAIKGKRPEYAQEQVHHTGSTSNNNVVIVLQGSDEDRDRLNKVMGIASPSDQGTGAGGGVVRQPETGGSL